MDTDFVRNYAYWPYRNDALPWVWAWCLGSINNDPSVGTNDAHYTFNVGATFVPYTSAFGNPQLYGHDPTVVVKGGGHKP